MARTDLLELAERISDGHAIDWARVERDAEGEEDRRVIRNLRLVESLTSFHRASEDATENGSAKSREEPRFRWGGLDVHERIGAGAFGEVYRAWDPNVEREVALKLLRVEHSGRPDFAARVIREARLLARVRHPNVVVLYGADTHGGRVGISMELVRGRSLAELLTEHSRFGAREAAVIGVDVCRALAAVHRAGLVHRDVKASNVLREEGGRILLMDFGLGSDASEVEEGTLSGTPHYIAPEIYAGEKSTPRSDLYSLGVLLYHLVTGKHPVEAESMRELRGKVERHESRLLRDERPDLPEPFVHVVERALLWEPAGRFATAGEMEQALAGFLGAEGGREPVVRRRGRAWLVAGGLTALAVLATALVLFGPVRSRLSGVGQQRATNPTALPSSAVPASYSVAATLYRVRPDGGREPLASGAKLSLGDELALEFKSTSKIYLYVIDEDDQGHAFALFPLPGHLPENPLPAGVLHLLPGADAQGAPTYWKVDTTGGSEHLLVLASPERLVEFEAELARLPRPEAGASAMPLPDQAIVRLRGIGALARHPETRIPAATGSGTRLFEMAERLAGGSEVVEGPWLRRIDLLNPAQ